jgi:phosphoglycolate phosphatase
MNFKATAVLFDLDGTLIDSAPDLGAAADRMRKRRGMSSLPLERYRHMAGAGARGMLGIAFGIKPSSPCFDILREEFFQTYERAMTERTQAFDGVAELLAQIGAAQKSWGIVTNKSERFALPLVAQMPLLQGSKATIGGDTTSYTKPHPEPVLEATRRLQTPPAQCVYAGDDERDIQAGRAAGCFTVACTWGYLGKNSDVHSWGADAVAEHPSHLLQYL